MTVDVDAFWVNIPKPTPQREKEAHEAFAEHMRVFGKTPLYYVYPKKDSNGSQPQS